MSFLEKNIFAEIKGDRFIVDMMYAKPENITLRPVYSEIGFGNTAIAHVDVVSRLMLLESTLIGYDMKLRICDAYRPPLAHRKILELIPVEGLFASKPENSLHCYGTAVDVCLTDSKGRNLKFPTEVDAYDKKYAKQIAKGNSAPFYEHFLKASQNFFDVKYSEETNNRELLKKIMTSVGFETINSEWWHYQIPGGKTDYPFVEWP